MTLSQLNLSLAVINFLGGQSSDIKYLDERKESQLENNAGDRYRNDEIKMSLKTWTLT